MRSILFWIFRNQKTIVITSCVLVALSIFGAYQIKVNNILLEDLSDNVFHSNFLLSEKDVDDLRVKKDEIEQEMKEDEIEKRRNNINNKTEKKHTFVLKMPANALFWWFPTIE